MPLPKPTSRKGNRSRLTSMLAAFGNKIFTIYSPVRNRFFGHLLFYRHPQQRSKADGSLSELRLMRIGKDILMMICLNTYLELRTEQSWKIPQQNSALDIH